MKGVSHNGTHVVMLCSENNDFVKLRDICQEIIHARSFCCPPTVLTLKACISHRKSNISEKTNIPG